MAASDAEGLLAYGPYDFLPPGRYQARFFLRREGEMATDSPIAILDVLGFTTGKMLAQREVRPTGLGTSTQYQVLALDFTNPSLQVLEYRVHFLGQAPLWFAGVEVLPQRP